MSTESEGAIKSSAKRNWIAAMVIVALLLGLSITAVNASRERARRDECSNKLRHVAAAIPLYYDVQRRFSPAYFIDAKNNPPRSWRALLIPFIDNHGGFYERKEAWNSPKNNRMAYESHSYFRCPSSTTPWHSTSYVAVVGPETMWPGVESLSLCKLKTPNGKPIRISGGRADYPPSLMEPRDLMSRTIMFVESADPTIHWMEPRDMPFDEAIQGIRSGQAAAGISSEHAGGAIVTYGDSHVSFLPKDTPPEKLRAELTAAGKEKGVSP